MSGLALLLLVSATGYALSRLLALPSVPLLLLSGAGMAALGGVEPAGLSGLLELGLAFLVFSAGLEVAPHRAGPQLRAAFSVGVLQFLLLGALGYLAARLLDLDRLGALYLALALAASSTLVVVRLVRYRRQAYDPVGRLVVGVLLLQDLLVTLALPLVISLPEGAGAVVAALGGVLLLTGAAVLLQGALGLLVRRRVELHREEGLLMVVALLFVFGAAARALGLPVVTGAFLAGFALSGLSVSGEVRGHTASLHDFFVAVFFTALGATVGIPSVAVLAQAVPLALVVVLLTPPLVALVVEAMGSSARTGIAAGLLLAQTSEFSLVVALHGAAAGSLPSETLAALVLVTAATMLLTPFLSEDVVVWRLLHLHPAGRRRPASAVPPRDHVVLLGCGSNGSAVLDLLLLQGRDVLIVDDDPTIVARVAEAGVDAVRGDATVPAVLDAAGVERATVVVSTLRRVEDNRPVLERARGRPVVVRGFSAEDARWIEELGGIPVVYAEAAAEEFLRWFDEESGLAGR